jgi:hypothetical protein
MKIFSGHERSIGPENIFCKNFSGKFSGAKILQELFLQELGRSWGLSPPPRGHPPVAMAQHYRTQS